MMSADKPTMQLDLIFSPLMRTVVQSFIDLLRKASDRQALITISLDMLNNLSGRRFVRVYVGDWFYANASPSQQNPQIQPLSEVANLPQFAPLFNRKAAAYLADVSIGKYTPEPDMVGVQSWMGISIWNNETLLAIFSVGSNHANLFNQETSESLAVFGSWLSLQMDVVYRMGLEAQMRQRFEHISQLLRDLEQSQNLEAVSETIVSRAKNFVPNEAALLLVYNATLQTFPLAIMASTTGVNGLSLAARNLLVDSPFIKRAMAEDSPFIVSDSFNQPDWSLPDFMPPMQSWLVTPLTLQDQSLALLLLGRGAAEAFCIADLAELTGMGQYCVYALQNAQLLRAEQRARRQAEALHKAARYLNSSLALDDLLAGLLDQLKQVVDYDSANVMFVENNLLMVKAAVGYELPIEEMRKVVLTMDMAGLVKVIHHHQTTSIPDTEKDPHWRIIPVGQQIRSWLGVPLISRSRHWGLISIDRHTPGAFEPDEIQAAENFAALTAGAIENAFLFEASQQQVTQMLDLTRASTEVSDTLELDDVLTSVAHQMATVMAVPIAFVGRWNPTHRSIESWLSYVQPGVNLHPLVGEDYFIDEYPATQVVLDNRQPLQFRADDPQLDAEERKFMQRTYIKTQLLIPLIYSDEFLGLVRLFDTERYLTFDDQAIARAKLLANHAASALANARLYQSVLEKARTDELTNLPNRLAFSEKLHTFMAHAEHQNNTLGVIMLDLDGYKQVNDAYDHMVGDDALRRIGQALLEKIPTGAFLARYGGDEFSLLIPDLPLAECDAIVEQLRQTVETCDLALPGEIIPFISISAGVAFYPLHQGQPKDLLRAADRALLYAKRSRFGRRASDRQRQALPLKEFEFGRVVYPPRMVVP